METFALRDPALGVQMDLTVDDVNGGEDDSWDAIWDSAGKVNGSGYTICRASCASRSSSRSSSAISR